jgi:hypothetical protein
MVVRGTETMRFDLDVIREMSSAFPRGDVASVLAAPAPKVVWIEAEGFPAGGTYLTPDAVLRNVLLPTGMKTQAGTVCLTSIDAMTSTERARV